ncbi:hypothetical protein EJD97_013507 [Solanum chilense]|uniref:Pentatricopeptide repeat-containing protein n=1 Tax=Solanum chilense TaxID=4083 RepID=A0A6N2BB18_SOLCI|nr:hypothetical protein EJD97_013507 [Solanum chilense]
MSLIDFYSNGGDVGLVRRVFDDLLVKSTATWTAIIAACLNVGKSEISLQLLRNMLETDVVPMAGSGTDNSRLPVRSVPVLVRYRLVPV